jgi:hypothetical protein
VLRELMLVLPSWARLGQPMTQLMEALHQGSAATVTLLVQGEHTRLMLSRDAS